MKLDLLCKDTGYLPHKYHIPEEIGSLESFCTGSKAPLQIIMATEHDSMFFQPEDDNGWSFGPFTIVKVLETLLQLERTNGKTKFLGNRAQFRLETESWKVLKRQVVATDRKDNLLSVTSDPPTKSTYFYLGTVWHQVTMKFTKYVSVGNHCPSILYQQSFELLFRFKNVERSIWTTAVQFFFQEG